uniref:bifunctional nuclease family protein n=1 Tax=Parolsenella massiliensis TaxID=1871022 RepID=UPI0009F83A86|nr:bifunctional nuclease family protein [Parolsenella massiliensis]
MDHMVEMTLRNLIVGGGPIPSAIILQPAGDENDSELVLPISVGTVDAANVARATNADDHKRPATHALLVDTIDALGGELESVSITRVEGATFFATLDVRSATGEQHHIDARPSDAISAAIEADAPVLASEDVLECAGLPDFAAVERDEQEREAAEFHDFVENLTPDDFKAPKQS